MPPEPITCRECGKEIGGLEVIIAELGRCPHCDAKLWHIEEDE